jgi:tetrahydromethanopterin S-methyltransferase subunit G
MTDDDLKVMVREFRTSVSQDLEAAQRRIDELIDEVRRRIGTAETAILNEIRDLSGRLDRRLERVEVRMGEIEVRMGGLEPPNGQ